MNFRASRPAAGRTAPSTPEADVVGTAEQIVRSARGREMYWALDHAECAVQDSYRDWDSACRYLVAAQRAGDPKRISTAHAALEQALDDARRNVAVRDRLLMALRGPEVTGLRRRQASKIDKIGRADRTGKASGPDENGEAGGARGAEKTGVTGVTGETAARAHMVLWYASAWRVIRRMFGSGAQLPA